MKNVLVVLKSGKELRFRAEDADFNHAGHWFTGTDKKVFVDNDAIAAALVEDAFELPRLPDFRSWWPFGKRDVVLTHAGEKRIHVIRVVRGLTGMSLKDSKELVVDDVDINRIPRTVLKNVDRKTAEGAAEQLRAQGAQVDVVRRAWL